MNAETGEIVDSGMTWQKATQAVQSSGVAHPDRAGAIASQVQDWVDKGRVARSFLLRHQVPKNLESAYEAAINVFQNMRISKGSFYTVDIPDEMIGKMLDYDKPLGQQREVLQKLKKAMQEIPYEGNRAFNGPRAFEIRTLLDSESKMRDYTPAGVFDLQDVAVVQWLREAGIPGVRYLDQGSRGAGDGTRNIVVFPGGEDQIKIVKVE
jgi:hypothetical protein